jgi:hypothetical protein
MDTPQNEFSHSSESQKTGFYLMVSIILGTGIYFLAQGIAQLWQ